MRVLSFTAALGAALLTAGCSYHEYKETKEVPAPPSRTTVVVPSEATPSAGWPYNLDLVDMNGHRYGTAHIDRDGYGRIYDNGGAEIGEIAPPRY